MAKRKVVFYKTHFMDFYLGLDDKTRKKVLQVLSWIQSLEIVPVSLMKKIESVKGLYEISDAQTHEFCVAQALREERIRAGLTQEQLAQMLGTKKTYISRVENGCQNINLTILYRIFRCLGKQVSITLI